jgi:hypothetical protein
MEKSIRQRFKRGERKETYHGALTTRNCRTWQTSSRWRTIVCVMDAGYKTSNTAVILRRVAFREGRSKFIESILNLPRECFK